MAPNQISQMVSVAAGVKDKELQWRRHGWAQNKWGFMAASYRYNHQRRRVHAGVNCRFTRNDHCI